MRVAVFIDGDSVQKLSQSQGFEVDFKRLRDMYTQLSDTVTFEYFTVEPIDNQKSVLRKLLDWLELNGFRLRNIEAEVTERDSIRVARAELVVWMALEIAAASKRADRIVIWSADRALLRAVGVAQEAGAAVTLVSDKTVASGRLMRSADVYLDARNLRGLIEQPKKATA